MSKRGSSWRGIKSAARGPSDPVAAALAADELAAEVERSKAEAMGLPWAEPVDLRASIDAGAPLPHLIADGDRAVLVFHAGLPAEPDWDGTTVTVIDPADSTIRRLSWLVLNGVAHVSLGASAGEALNGRALYDSGIRHDRAHEFLAPSSE